MTIDEAIAHAREVAEIHRKDNDNCKYKSQYGCKDCADYYSKPCIECAEEHEQLAEWLEELKALRNGLKIKCDSLNESLEKGKKIGYNKAIDECLSILYRNAGKIISIRFYEEIFNEMKKLKVGGTE